MTKKPFLLLFFWKNLSKTAKLWSLRHQKQGFPTYSTFSRKSGSSYEKIGKKHFFMSQNTPPFKSLFWKNSFLAQKIIFSVFTDKKFKFFTEKFSAKTPLSPLLPPSPQCGKTSKTWLVFEKIFFRWNREGSDVEKSAQNCYMGDIGRIEFL